jgi:hypothetical protein
MVFSGLGLGTAPLLSPEPEEPLRDRVGQEVPMNLPLGQGDTAGTSPVTVGPASIGWQELSLPLPGLIGTGRILWGHT